MEQLWENLLDASYEFFFVAIEGYLSWHKYLVKHYPQRCLFPLFLSLSQSLSAGYILVFRNMLQYTIVNKYIL